MTNLMKAEEVALCCMKLELWQDPASGLGEQTLDPAGVEP